MTDTRAGGGNQLTGRLYVAAAVSAVAAVLYGYDTGIISGALLQIEDDFDIGSTWKQLIAASILLGAIIGALACSRLSERRGRRGTILIIAVIFFVGAICCMVAPDKFTLSLSRILLGFAVGGGTQVVPMYVAELAPAPVRGRLVLTFQVGHRRRDRPLHDRRGHRGPRLAHRDRHRGHPGGGHVRPHAAAPGEPALARQAQQP